MKKEILSLVAVILGLMACNEQEFRATEPKERDQVSNAPMPMDNYCKGCGVSNIAADGCHGDDCREDYICEMTEAQNVANNANIPFDLSFNDAYEIRDSFLIKSLKGQDYISHFYEFGGFLFDNELIGPSNILDFVTFGHEVFDAVNDLRTGDTSVIVVTTQFKTRCMSYINLIRANDPPNYIVNRLNMVEDDLFLFENKSKSYILSFL